MHEILKTFSCCLLLLLTSHATGAERLFDAHVHYNATDAAHYPPELIIAILDQNSVSHAVVTSNPPDLVKQLQLYAPERIIPLLGVYEDAEDKENWTQDSSLPARIEEQLKQGGWRGIGELHLFADDRHSLVFRRIIELAGQYRIPLMLHTDPAVIDTLYEIAPQQPVIWAHAGTFPCPDLIADYLRRYPALSADLSVRDERIAPGGEISDAWYELLITHPDRFMVGIDTFSLSRWKNYGKVAWRIRQWVRQLPEETASKLLYGNAALLFIGNREGSQY
jgi:hypothetical protein